MDQSIFIQYGVFVGIIFCSDFYKFGYKSCLSVEAITRYEYCFTTPTNDSGMQEYKFFCEFRDQNANQTIEVLPKVPIWFSECDRFTILDNRTNTVGGYWERECLF